MDDIFIFLICFFLFSRKSFTLRIYFYYNQEQTNKQTLFLFREKKNLSITEVLIRIDGTRTKKDKERRKGVERFLRS